MTRITDEDLKAWAGKLESRGDLPILIRRLVHSTTRGASKIDFPAGESTGLPGNDGVVVTGEENGSAWVPDGESLWEVSCRADCNAKAAADYDKRTKQTPSASRGEKSFVFATPRGWRNRNEKGKWESERRERDGWKSVHALDAVNLEQWIETSTSVRVWMAAKLGRAFAGYHTLRQEWDRWALATKPELSPALVLAERQDAAEKLSEWLATPPTEPFRVIADSRDEAVAFVCAALVECKEHADRLVVVRGGHDEAHKMLNAEGSPQPIFLFAEESDAVFALRRRVHVIIADAKGGQREDKGQPGLLRRISREGFIKAIVDMGCAEKEAEKLNRESGRSVSILRRRLAPQDSKIARPDWAKRENVQVMIAAALAGRWDENSEFDRDFVSRLAGTDYETFEARVNEFRIMEDSPVEKIGGIWMVRSRIDALLGAAEHIVPGAMRPFWKGIENLLAIRNPELDLPDDERMFAPIRGKTPPYSSTLFSASADTLILLSVYQEQMTACDNLECAVEGIVWKVLQDAGSDRWRSLSGLMPKLAEAAPAAFMAALEEDLQKETPSVSSLFSTNSEGPFSRSDHTGLLWALEILAWDQRFLPRVIDALAQMDFALPGNLMNRPSNTLLSFFRPWFPQCGMEVDGRIEQFRRLSATHPEIAWHLSRTMVQSHDTASDNALPRWSGVPEFANRKGVTDAEYWKMKEAAFEVMKNLIAGQLERIIAVLDMFQSFNDEQMGQIAAVISSWQEGAGDEEKAEARAKVINNLYLCNLWSGKNRGGYDSQIKMFEELCEKLMPTNLIHRHKWLFKNTWIELPDHSEMNGLDEKVRRRQAEAALEIYKAEGAMGVFRMAAVCGAPGRVGRAVVDELVKNDDDRLEWISKIGKRDMEDTHKRPFIFGLLEGVSEWKRIARLGFERAAKENWDDGMILSFALALHSCPDVWDAVERRCSEHVRSKYWESTRPPDKKDVPRYVAETMKRGRPDAALNRAATCGFHGIEANRIIEMLEALLRPPNNRRIDFYPGVGASYHIARAMSFVANSGVVSEERIIGLEISFYEVIRRSKHKPAALFKRLATDPALFVDFVCRIYKRKDGKPDEYSRAPKEQMEAAARKCGKILKDWDVPPGCADADNFNESQFVEWMGQARELARKMDRSDATDLAVGKILICLPEDKDGLRFPAPVLQWLQDKDKGTEKMLDSLGTAFFNSRGVVIKSPVEGGGQERTIADKYRQIADNLRLYPRVADVFDRLAKSYEWRGEKEDERAALNDRRWD